jgi:hypothetical protein
VSEFDLSVFLFAVYSFGILTGVLACLCTMLWPTKGRK